MGGAGEDRPRIGLALGSGAARGWSHIGILRALDELGVVPDVICGSSIGALVGAAHAGGRLDTLEAWVRTLTWKKVVQYMDVTLSGGGFVQGERLIAFFREHVLDVAIEDLPVRFGAVATELDTGREVWFRQGSVLEAVRASISLPGLFTPARVDGRWMVDGGLVNPVPVSLCRALGAEVVIAVNLNGDVVGKRRYHSVPVVRPEPIRKQNDVLERIAETIRQGLKKRADELLDEWMGEDRDAPGLIEVMAGSIYVMQDRITRSRMAGDPPDILLTPRLAHLRLMDFDRAGEAIDGGRKVVDRMGETILDVTGLA